MPFVDWFGFFGTNTKRVRQLKTSIFSPLLIGERLTYSWVCARLRTAKEQCSRINMYSRVLNMNIPLF